MHEFWESSVIIINTAAESLLSLTTIERTEMKTTSRKKNHLHRLLPIRRHHSIYPMISMVYYRLLSLALYRYSVRFRKICFPLLFLFFELFSFSFSLPTAKVKQHREVDATLNRYLHKAKERKWKKTNVPTLATRWMGEKKKDLFQPFVDLLRSIRSFVCTKASSIIIDGRKSQIKMYSHKNVLT